MKLFTFMSPISLFPCCFYARTAEEADAMYEETFGVRPHGRIWERV